MKTPIFEKSVWKWIFAWLATCWVFFLGAFAAEFSLSGLKIELPNRLLQQAKWNGLIDAMGWFASSVNANLKNSEIPAWTIIIYEWEGNPCPPGWSQWTWWWDKAAIMPLASGKKTRETWGRDQFTITKENLPKHSHKIMVNTHGTPWLSPDTSLAVRNVEDATTNNWDADYILVWSSSTPTVGKTSEWWADGEVKSIELNPLYQRVLFCKKDPAHL